MTLRFAVLVSSASLIACASCQPDDVGADTPGSRGQDAGQTSGGSQDAAIAASTEADEDGGQAIAGSLDAAMGASSGTVGSQGAMDAAQGVMNVGVPGDGYSDAAASEPEGGVDSGSGGDALSDAAFYVYVGTGDWGASEPGRVALYRLAPDGELSFVERIDAGAIGSFMALDAPRRRLYVADEGAGVLRRYALDAQTGRLTLGDSISVSGAPVYVTLDSAGDTLLTADYDQGLIRAFALGDGGFVEPAADTESTGSEAHSVVISPDDRFAYVCNKGSQTISQFAFDAATHTLTPLAVPSVAHPGGPRHAALSPDGRFLYVVSENDDSVVQYRRAADGSLSAVQSFARLPDGQSGTGADIHFSPYGHLYVSNRGSSNTLTAYRVDPSSGALSVIEHDPTGGQTPRNFSIDPRGRFLLVANRESQNVVVFSIDAARGELRLERTVAVEGSPFFVGGYLEAPSS